MNRVFNLVLRRIIADKHDLVLCDHIIGEVRDVVSLKRPDLLGDFDVLLAQLSAEKIAFPKAANAI